jgi:hypothetical protein
MPHSWPGSDIAIEPHVSCGEVWLFSSLNIQGKLEEGQRRITARDRGRKLLAGSYDG